MSKHPEYKKKLLAEILPSVEAVSKNIVEDLTYETVMEYDYLVKCYTESLRIESPIANSSWLEMTEDSVINVGVN